MFSCNSYEWDQEIKEMTGGNLKKWLHKTPFDNLWDIHGEKNTITNLKEVFPLYKGFVDKEGKEISKDSIFEDAVLVIKDSLGEGYSYAALFNSDQKIYLKESYYERGNVIFSGVDSYKDSHQAHLKKIFEGSNPNYISEFYNVTIGHNYNSKNYILCHFSKNKFLFQVLFVHNPIYDKEKLIYAYNYTDVIKKIKRINKEMDLKIKEWENISISDLKLEGQ